MNLVPIFFVGLAVFQLQLYPLTPITSPFTWLQLNLNLLTLFVVYWASVIISGFNNFNLLTVSFVSRAHLAELHESLSSSFAFTKNFRLSGRQLTYFRYRQVGHFLSATALVYRNIALSRKYLMRQFNCLVACGLPLNVYGVSLLLNCYLSPFHRNVLLTMMLVEGTILGPIFELVKLTQAFYQSTGRVSSIQANMSSFKSTSGIGLSDRLRTAIKLEAKVVRREDRAIFSSLIWKMTQFGIYIEVGKM